MMTARKVDCDTCKWLEETVERIVSNAWKARDIEKVTNLKLQHHAQFHFQVE